MQYLTYVGGTKIAADKVVGPLWHDADWEFERSYAAEASRQAAFAPVAVAWKVLSRAWGLWACKAAIRLGHITGTPVKAPEKFKGMIRPKWISYAYEGQDAEGIQAVADGWQCFADAVKGIA
eukprot:1510860-Pyramimonas_sp.AAC.1